MKHKSTLLAPVIAAALLQAAPGQTIDWGSEAFSTIVNSSGLEIDSTYVIELGAFDSLFTPTQNNVNQWLANWRVFDATTYNTQNDIFASTASMNDNGSSSYNPGAPSFEGLAGYLWIRKGDAPVAGSEWMLARATNWVFPVAQPGCCDNQQNLQWSVTDMGTTDIPVWGNQDGTPGSGVYTTTGPYPLQTFTFVPEPTSLALGMLSAGLLLRRRRHG